MEYVACNLCGARSDEKLFTTPRDGTMISIVRCKACGLVYQNPRMSGKEIAALYNRKKKHYRSKPAGTKEKKFLLLAEGRIKNIERFASKGKLLDIGSAFGPLLAAAKLRGWQAEGVELARHMADFAEKRYGVRIYAKPVEKLRLKAENFDVVTMYDVIEHLLDPKKTLVECNRILKAGGLLVIQTPAVDSLYASMKGKDWPYFGLHHTYYFSRKTMGKMLHAAGFRIVKIFNGDDIGMRTHMRVQAGMRHLAFQLARRINCGKTFGSRVYYARKVKISE